MISIGTVLKHYGKVAAIGNIDGERYYWFDKDGNVSMMPAAVIEKEKCDE